MVTEEQYWSVSKIENQSHEEEGGGDSRGERGHDAKHQWQQNPRGPPQWA